MSGGKGANLHRLISLNHNVPEGFVISTAAQQVFFKENLLQSRLRENFQLLQTANPGDVTRAAEAIRFAIKEAPFPPELLNEVEIALGQIGYAHTFAVRSSGAREDSTSNSWAGQFDSFLDVKIENVPNCIKQCWASLFTSRAVTYNVEAYRNLADIEFAVVIQRMVPSDVSGVAFSLEPVANDRSKVVIEASRGVAQNLLSGGEVAFSAIMDKSEDMLLKKSYSQQKYAELLSMDQLSQISKEVMRIEEEFEMPVDVEWSYAAGKLFLLQVRPATGLLATKQSPPTAALGKYPNINDYELTFKVSGLSFLFCDILIRGFEYLSPLFTSNRSDFRQYFPNERMEFAAKEGYRWLSRPDGFRKYQLEFEMFNSNALLELEEIINDVPTRRSADRFVQIVAQYLTYYSKMDFQFTNSTYAYANTNEVIGTNLRLLSQFKDVARVWINKVAIEVDGYFARFVARLSDQLGMQIRDLELYKVEEIFDLFDGLSVSDEQLCDREKSYTMFIRSRQRIYLAGDESSAFIARIAEADDLIADAALNGVVANKTADVISGVVRLINVDYGNPNAMEQEISNMREGEILVSEFTAPELMSACRKAGAIVTDLGGMLSHAAIVSRELGIPCLVGTRHASKTLKTGDAIFIDFRSGRIIKHVSKSDV